MTSKHNPQDDHRMEELRSLTNSQDELHFSIPKRPLISAHATQLGIPVHRASGFAIVKDTPNPLPTRSRTGAVVEKLKRISSYNWLIEILSCLLATVALIATIVTLAIHRGRPLPQWPHLISINSLIAIFIAILKAAVLMPVAEGISQQKWYWFRQSRTLIDLDRFDSASRGPWGSFKLLFRIRQQYKSAAIFGAFLTVAALAIDPFSQQVIHYYDCPQSIPDAVASIPRINNYTTDVRYMGGLYILDGPMTAALYLGLLSPPRNGSSNIPFNCITGNCTFPADNRTTYTSLTMCQSCHDINDTVVNNGNNTDGFRNWTIPSGPSINQSVVLSTTGIYDEENPALFTLDTLMIQEYDCGEPPSGRCERRPWAFRCMLYPCLKTYAANITQSVLEEHIVATTRVPYDTRSHKFILVTNRTLRNGTWQDCRASNQPTKHNPIAYKPISASGASKLSVEYYPVDCFWSINYYTVLAFNSYLGGLFDDQILQAQNSRLTSVVGPAWLEKLGRFGAANISTVNAFMDGLANSITATMRQSGDISGPALGVTYGWQTCVGVQWAWLSLPASLLGLSIAFLFATIVQTSAHRSNTTWKSSSLALVFHGLGNETKEKYRFLEGIDEMNDTARSMQAKLSNTDAGWTFTEEN